MAVVTPVLLVLALISYNVAMFACAVARFDRVAPDVVVAHGVSPAGEEGLDMPDAVRTALERAMEGHDVEIEVEILKDAGESDSMLSLVAAPVAYRCTMKYKPWPAGLSVAGVRLGAPAWLVHEREVTVDPWRSGVVM